MSVAQARIAELYVHPIKGARGIAVKSATLSRTGLQWDRQFAVVLDGSSPAKFVSQRSDPRLALVEVSLPEGADTLHITAPGMAPLEVPLKPSSSTQKQITVWEWTGTVLDEGEAPAAWFTQFFGKPCRLVRYMGSLAPIIVPEGAPPKVRSTDPNFATGYEVALSDGFPILLGNAASLQDLNDRLVKSGGPEASLAPLSIRRFRPNVVVSGLGPWEEDAWRQVEIRREGAEAPPIKMLSVKPCGRCAVPTVDPATGVKSQGEPSDTLATFRTGSQLGYTEKTWKHQVHFGWNVVFPETAIGQTLAIGDVVEFSVPQQAF